MLADLAAPDLDDRQEFLAETSETFNSAPPGSTLVRKLLCIEAAAPLHLPKKGNAAPHPRRSRRVGSRKHPRGHRKTRREALLQITCGSRTTNCPTTTSRPSYLPLAPLFWPMTSQNSRLAISLSLDAIYLVCKVHPTLAPPWRTFVLRQTSLVESSGTTIVHQSQTLHSMYCLCRIVLRCWPQR